MTHIAHINCSPTYARSHSRNSRVCSCYVRGCTHVLSSFIHSYTGQICKTCQFSSIPEPLHSWGRVAFENCAADGEWLALNEIVIAANYERTGPRTDVGREFAKWWPRDALVNQWWSHCREGKPTSAISYMCHTASSYGTSYRKLPFYMRSTTTGIGVLWLWVRACYGYGYGHMYFVAWPFCSHGNQWRFTLARGVNSL